MIGGVTKIIKIQPDGLGYVEIASETAGALNFTLPDINDDGEVTFIGQLPYTSQVGDATHKVFVGDGLTALETRLEIVANGGSGLGPEINNASTVAGYQPSLIAVAEAGDLANDPSNVIYDATDISGFLGFLGLNDAGQVAYADGSGLYVDGTPLVEIGGLFNGQEVTSIIVRDNLTFNTNAQVIAEVRTVVRNEIGNIVEYGTYAVRFDPEGATPDNPLVPFASTPAGENDIALNIVNGLGVTAPIWVDPIVATGFTYTQGLGGANIASLTLPTALPFTQSVFDLSFDYTGGSHIGTIGLGETLDFTAYDPLGVSAFSILGIDVAEMVDPNDPFVVGLTFVSGGFSSTLSIDATTVDTDAQSPIPSPVPLPAGFPLLAGALALLGLARLRRLS